MLVTEDTRTLAEQIKPVPGRPMAFTASAVIRPKQYQSLELIPFFRVHDSRYMLYWRLATPPQYDEVVQQLKVEEQAHRPSLRYRDFHPSRYLRYRGWRKKVTYVK
jgi:hypothetical protein